ncbi:hypothetical protein CHUAL_008907 [Chamberlinius hualienensis]
MKRLTGKKVFFSVLIVATVAHLIFLTTEYIRCSEVEHVETKQHDNVTFPSVTLCSNVPIRRNVSVYWMMEDFGAYLVDDYDGLSIGNFEMEDLGNVKLPQNIRNGTSDYFLDIENITKKNEMEVLSQFAKYNSSDRLKYAEFPDIKMKIFIITATFQEDFTTLYWSHHIFNNLYYGNCLTINFDKMLKKKDKKVNSVGFEIKIERFRNGYNKDTNTVAERDDPSESNVMVIHEPYTQPIFDMRNVIKLIPYTDMSAAITKSEYIHEQNCVPREEINHEMEPTDMFYTEQQYVYSYEDCVSSCLQNLTMKYCQCQLPQFYADSQLPVCRSALQVNTIIEIKVNAFNMLIQSNFICRGLVTHTKVTLSQPTHVTTVVRLDPECKFEIVLSQVGGILGVYVGLSILTVVEFIYNWIAKVANKNKKKVSELSSCKNEGFFIGRSSISAVAITTESRNRLKKLFWILMLTSALYKTFEQGYLLLDNFLKYPVIETTNKISEIEFPAVTICSNVIFSQTTSDELKEKYFPEYIINGHTAIFFEEFFGYVAKQSFEERLSLGPKADFYIRKCYYWNNKRKYHCRQDIEFTMGKLGNCATINSGLLNGVNNPPINSSELFLELQYVDSQVRTLVDKIGLSVFIHPKGTSPNMECDQLASVVTPNSVFTLTFSTVVHNHLPFPYPSQCISELSPEYQWVNIFHDHHRQYKYTLETCLTSEMFNQTMTNPCMLHAFVLNMQGRLYTGNYFYKIFANSTKECNKNFTFPSFHCPSPCHEIKYIVEELRKVEVYKNSSYYFANLASLNDTNQTLYKGYLPSVLLIRPLKIETTVIEEVAAIAVKLLLFNLNINSFY